LRPVITADEVQAQLRQQLAIFKLSMKASPTLAYEIDMLFDNALEEVSSGVDDAAARKLLVRTYKAFNQLHRDHEHKARRINKPFVDDDDDEEVDIPVES
jgi:hypothetical protein